MKGKITDYRTSHTSDGKGNVYHDSFSKFPFRKQMWEWEKKELKKIFANYTHSKSSILDFACGTGRILTFLTTQSDNITGVDLSDSMLEVSKKNLPNVELVKADITRDNVFKGKRQFDVITAFRFFLNAQNSLRKEVLEALHPLLKDEGIFIFNNHGNAFNLDVNLGRWIHIKNLFRKPENRIAYNYHSLTGYKLKKLLDNAGFEIIEKHHRSIIPVLGEKTSFNVSKINKLEDLFSSLVLFRPFARNIMYVCKKKQKK